jgi:diphosphomevalonate decarboxylase
VEFVAGEDHQSSYAEQIADEQYWDLVDIVAVVDAEKKKVSSSLGHKLADTSPYFETRIKEMQERIIQCRQAILERDIEKLGVATEQDSVSLHAVMMTSRPPAVYWGPGSMGVWQEVMQWREEEGLQAYCAFDAGANPHVICEKKDAKEVQKRLEANEFVQWTIWNQPCAGVRVVEGED